MFQYELQIPMQIDPVQMELFGSIVQNTGKCQVVCLVSYLASSINTFFMSDKVSFLVYLLER